MWCLGRFLPLLIGAHVPCAMRMKVATVHLVLRNYGCSIFTSHYKWPTKLHSSKTFLKTTTLDLCRCTQSHL